MKIEKIKNFNQIMLAVGLSIGAIFLIVALIVFIAESGISNRHYQNPSGLISDEEVETLNQENLRKQVVSYAQPQLADSVNSIYVIPISVLTLKKPESSFGSGSEAKYAMDAAEYKTLGLTSRKYIGSAYSNLIIYNAVKNSTISLFNERIFIGNVEICYFKDDILIVCTAAVKDTEKDGTIDYKDDQILYIYSLNHNKLRKVDDGENSIKSYDFINNSKNLLINFTLAEHKNKNFNSYEKPTKIMRYDFETEKLSEIIPRNIQNQMQKLVEGEK